MGGPGSGNRTERRGRKARPGTEGLNCLRCGLYAGDRTSYGKFPSYCPPCMAYRVRYYNMLSRIAKRGIGPEVESIVRDKAAVAEREQILAEIIGKKTKREDIRP